MICKFLVSISFTKCKFTLKCFWQYLPPASEGWVKVIFSVCSHLVEGVPHPRSVGRGYPIPGLGGGVPHPRSGGWYPVPGLDGGLPGYLPLARSGWGVPGVPPLTY